jgi:hypothetical protein
MPLEYDRILGSADHETTLPPVTQTGSAAGFSAPADVQSQISSTQQQQVAQMATEILRDPLAMRLLCDRVYDLLQTDLRHQQERSQSYGRR